MLSFGAFQGTEHGGRGAAGIDRVVSIALAVRGDGLELLEGRAAEQGMSTPGSGEIRSDAWAGDVADRGEVGDARNVLARSIT